MKILKLILKTRNRCLEEIHEHPQEIGFDDTIIKDRVNFRNLVNQHKFTEKSKKAHTGGRVIRKTLLNPKPKVLNQLQIVLSFSVPSPNIILMFSNA